MYSNVFLQTRDEISNVINGNPQNFNSILHGKFTEKREQNV